MASIIITTIPTDDGRRDAIALDWNEVEGILGERHSGEPEQDRRLIAHLVAHGAPTWVEDAKCWADKDGWGVVGPIRREYRRGDAARSAQILLRVAEAEREAWRAAAGEQGISAWLRGLANQAAGVE